MSKAMVFMKSYRNQNKLNVNADNFITFNSKYHVYLLGLIWADGYVHWKRNFIRVEILLTDALEILDVFKHTGRWSISKRHRKDRQEQITFECSNKKLVEWLKLNDYDKKSLSSPNKIYEDIPPDLKRYFLRWFDGDGCFYENKKEHIRQFILAGSLEQDWTCVENICNDNGIKYSIQRRKPSKNGHVSSQLRISSIEGIKKLYHIVYDDLDIGFWRKYIKVNDILSNYGD
jgi:hypothetical protein